MVIECGRFSSFKASKCKRRAIRIRLRHRQIPLFHVLVEMITDANVAERQFVGLFSPMV
jgi:hypothetical protein